LFEMSIVGYGFPPKSYIIRQKSVNRQILQVEYHIFHVINQMARQSGLLDNIAIVLSKYGPLLFVLPLAYLWFFEGTDGKKAALLALASMGIALLVAQFISHVSFRERPPFAHPGDVKTLIDIATDSSFPSDHATFSFGIAWVIWFKDSHAGWAALGLALLIALSRVFVGTHYPLDVIGGALIALASALLVWSLRKQLDPVTSLIVSIAGKFRL
jgi:undecaprenyl-diphosphatase